VTRRARARQAARSVRPVYWLLGLHGVSSFCYGMVLPYTSIFLAEQDGVGTGGVAAYYAASGVANMAIAAVLALGWVRPPRIALGVAGNALSALGYLVLPAVSSASQAALAAVAVGAGQGCFLAAVIPIVSSLIEESETRRVFALRYQILNATFALGSLAAGVLTTLLTSSVLPYLFVVCAVGYLPIAFALLVTRGASEAGREARRSQSEAAGGDGRPLPVKLLLRAALGVVVFEAVVALFAFAQFEGTAPLVAYKLMDVGLSWIPVLIAFNVAVVVLAQPLMTRIIEPRGDVFGLRAAVGLWVAGYALVGLAALAGPFALPGLLGYAALFGLGECAYSCSFYPWMIGKVPDSELTRITALTNGMMGVGLFAGPPIGIALVGGGSAALVWFSLAALCAVAVVGTVHGAARRVGNVPAANGAG
jgi:MFS family permease